MACPDARRVESPLSLCVFYRGVFEVKVVLVFLLSPLGFLKLPLGG